MEILAQKAKVNWDSCQYNEQAKDWMLQKWGSIPTGAEDFLVFTKFRPTPGPTPAFWPVSTEISAGGTFMCSQG